MEKENKMGVMPVGKLVISMGIPMMLSMLFSMTFGLVAVERQTQARHPKESLKVLGSYREKLLL